jgi:hypothetical protein
LADLSLHQVHIQEEGKKMEVLENLSGPSDKTYQVALRLDHNRDKEEDNNLVYLGLDMVESKMLSLGLQ